MRIRQRGEEGHYIYYKTVKRQMTEMKRIKIGRRLTLKEYLQMMMDADTAKQQIRKTRYCLLSENTCFGNDIYPFWTDRAIVESE